MRKFILFMLLAGYILAACTPGVGEQVDDSRLVTIYKLPT